MKLRTKLLLGIGILLVLLFFIMFVLPSYFIRKDVYKTADQIHDLLIKEHEQLTRSQQLWLKSALENTKENTDALLFMLNEAPQLSADLIFDAEKSTDTAWDALSRVAGYDPSIGFVQLHDPKLNKIARISPHATTLFSIEEIQKEGETVLISLSKRKNQQEETLFIGYPLQSKSQKEQGYTFYALIDPKNGQEEVALLKKEMERITQQRIEQELYEGNQFFSGESQAERPSFQWGIKMNLIRVLTPFFAESSLSSEYQNIPAGIARVDPSGKGYAVLTKEAYSSHLLFDDVQYFQAHQPPPHAPPLANGSVIVTQDDKYAYIANTLQLKDTFFSLGVALDFLPMQLALSTNGITLLQIRQIFWIGYGLGGKPIPANTLREAVSAVEFKENKDVVNFEEPGAKAHRDSSPFKDFETKLHGSPHSALKGRDCSLAHVQNRSYFVSRVVTLEKGSLILYELHPYEEVKGILDSLRSLEHRLTHRISTQLSLIALGAIVLILFFVGRFGFTVIYPITKLASATQDVAAGRYGEVLLPDVGKRKDEVATLTRSFEEMVIGLQEREKIRGVLDKVVSKDVADEILKTQIHLGGEDRIVTMLFCDIRGFSTLTANLSPQKTIQLLNACMTKVSRVIEGEGGVIDKYVGDEVMAIFGAPSSHPDHALRAVSTGMLIVETLKKWNEARSASGEPIIFEMGIGIHTGLVVAGNMGAEDRLNYTVLGANVNLAARLCEVAQRNQLIISAETLAQPNVKESFYTRPLTPIILKGFTEPVQIYEITGFKWEE